MSDSEKAKRDMGRFSRFVAWTFGQIFKLQLGYVAPSVEEMVRTYGVSGFMKSMAEGTKLLAALDKRYGVVETQYLIAISGLMSGCRWCSTGHMLSGNLLLYHADGELGPLNEQNISQFEQMTDEHFVEEIRSVLDVPRWRDLLTMCERLIALHCDTAAGETPDDPFLTALNTQWEWTTECTIQQMDWNPALIPAIIPLFKDKVLYKKYLAARAEQ